MPKALIFTKTQPGLVLGIGTSWIINSLALILKPSASELNLSALKTIHNYVNQLLQIHRLSSLKKESAHVIGQGLITWVDKIISIFTNTLLFSISLLTD